MTKHYLYTETAFHHEGDLDFMFKLIDATVDSGAQGIKFQVLTDINDFVSCYHTSFETLKGYCFTLPDWKKIFSYCVSKKLDIIMMPLNIDSLKLCTEFNIKYLDIHSVSFYDDSLLQAVIHSGVDIILGVGGRTLEEIISKKKELKAQLKVLMVGFQSFPSKLEKVKMGRIKHLKGLFPDLQIGYADHSAFDHENAVNSNEIAMLLGASIFEKHITINEGQERVDFSAAISSKKIQEIIHKLSFLQEFVLTDFIESFQLNEEETTYRNRQLICVASKQLDKGHKVTNVDISLKLIDTKAKCFYDPNTLIGGTIQETIIMNSAFTSANILVN